MVSRITHSVDIRQQPIHGTKRGRLGQSGSHHAAVAPPRTQRPGLVHDYHIADMFTTSRRSRRTRRLLSPTRALRAPSLVLGFALAASLVCTSPRGGTKQKRLGAGTRRQLFHRTSPARLQASPSLGLQSASTMPHAAAVELSRLSARGAPGRHPPRLARALQQRRRDGGVRSSQVATAEPRHIGDCLLARWQHNFGLRIVQSLVDVPRRDSSRVARARAAAPSAAARWVWRGGRPIVPCEARPRSACTRSPLAF